VSAGPKETNDAAERQRLYERTRDDLAATGRSVSQSYDRAMLTLSSAFLGGSLAFVGQIVDLPNASAKWLLYLAWLLFALTIIFTLASFIYGLHTLQPLRDAAERYYMQRDQEAWKVSERVQRIVLRYVVACGVSFLLGIIFLGAFVVINPAK
jgi:sterol desaturase/sphingolipid hydroxylase (fatty acid hydroxylase superfamily)